MPTASAAAAARWTPRAPSWNGRSAVSTRRTTSRSTRCTSCRSAKGGAGSPSGIANQIVGGWRVAVIQAYSSGLPIGVTTNAPLNIFNGTNRPERHRPGLARADRRRGIRPAGRSVPEPGGVRAAGRRAGQRAAHQPRRAAVLEPEREPQRGEVDQGLGSSSISTSVSKPSTCSTACVWGAPNTDFSSNNFGLINTQANSPRQMQIGLKLYW